MRKKRGKYRSYKMRIYEENSKEVADKLWQDYLLKISQNLDGFIRRYGEELGKKKYNSFIEKSKHTKAKYVKKYGKILGNKKWNTYIQKKKETSKRSIEYWLKKYDGDYELARIAQSNYQKRDRDFFIKKYGKEIGITKYNHRAEKQRKSINEHYKTPGAKGSHAVSIKKMIKKYGEEIGEQKYKEYLLKTSPGIIWNQTSVSNISQEFCKTLESSIDKKTKQYVKYAAKNDEWWIYDSDRKKYFFYDFAIIKSNNKKIIEFNGDFWHANPSIYTENWKHKVLNTTAKDLWKKDEYKHNLAKENGFDILIIWEKEWRDNKEDVIKRSINFINNIKEK